MDNYLQRIVSRHLNRQRETGSGVSLDEQDYFYLQSAIEHLTLKADITTLSIKKLVSCYVSMVSLGIYVDEHTTPDSVNGALTAQRYCIIH